MENKKEITMAETTVCFKLVEILTAHKLGFHKTDLIINTKYDHAYSEKIKLYLTKQTDGTWLSYFTLKGQNFEGKLFSSIIPAIINAIKMLATSDEEYIEMVRELLNSDEIKKVEAKTYGRKKD